MRTESLEPSLLTALTIIGLAFLLVGFVGWLTEIPQPNPTIRAIDRFNEVIENSRPWLEDEKREVAL